MRDHLLKPSPSAEEGEVHGFHKKAKQWEAAFPGLNARKGDSKEAGVRSFRVGLEDTRLHKKQ